MTLPTSGTYYLSRYLCKSKHTKITWNKDTYKLDITNENNTGEVVCNLNFESKPKLASMKIGSYVAYTGNNGCTGNACSGQNANYVSDANMGYCSSSNYKFYSNGWRIAYSKDGAAYLTSGGSPECLCTSSDGTLSINSSCSTYLSATDFNKHIDNLNNRAIKYCNSDYAYNGQCNSDSAWNMNNDDFKMQGKTLSSCTNISSNKACGYTNDLIDNGGYYWFATPYSASSNGAFNWVPSYRDVSYSASSRAYGGRPVLRLQSSVVVTGGTGTMDDPYKIVNGAFSINNGNSYVGASAKASVPMKMTTISATKMCISVNTSVCNNYITFSNTYNLNLSSESDGEKTVYVYYKDSTDKVIASLNKKIILDTVAPTDNKVSIGDGQGLSRTLAISSTGASEMCFSNTNISSSACTSWVPYATSYTWTLSNGTGSKTVYAFFRDKAGNTSSTTATTIVAFNVNEDFSDTTYDSNITVAGSGSYPWKVNNSRFESTNQNQDSTTSTSTIQFTPTSAAKLSFDYGVSSESNYDKLTITLTGSNSTSTTLVNAISGTSTGSKTDVALTAGVTYTLTLSYSKDGSQSKNSDIGYIDNLKITS